MQATNPKAIFTTHHLVWVGLAGGVVTLEINQI
jgi:hypothetical protein